jgi:hypothetical protein
MSAQSFPRPAPLEIRVAIGDLIARMGYLIDRLDWDKVAEGLCDQVGTDFVSLLGGDPKVQSKAELLIDYAAFLPGFHALQHMINLVDLELLTDNSARSSSYVRATHRFDDGLWIVGGIYHHSLLNLGGVWKISSIQFKLLYEEGDRALAEKAAKRAGDLRR